MAGSVGIEKSSSGEERFPSGIRHRGNDFN